MKCRNKKCEREFDQAFSFCPYCGTSVSVPERKRNPKSRGNGQGTAYKRGKTWTARVTRYITITMPDGKKKVERIEKTKGGFPSKTAALSYCTDLWSKPNRVQCNMTFYELFQRWQAFYEDRIKSTTMACYKAAFKYFESIQYLEISSISPDDLQGCMDKCNKGRSTKDDMRTVCSLVYKYAMQNGFVEVNQAQFLFVGREKKGTRPPFTTEELSRIENAISEYPYADYVYIMCYTGFRPNEFLSMKKDAYREEKIDGEDTPILEGGFKTKAGTDRWVMIHPKIQGIINELMKADGEYLFPNKEDGSMMNDEFFRKKCFMPLMNQLKIEGKVPYSCRHTFSNLMKTVEGSEVDKARLMGHTEASMTRRYQSADLISMKAIIYAM